MTKPVPIILISGFLGSGKTTFIRKILEDNHLERKIGIIQNEFAPANVDGQILRESDKPFELLELNNGSVFCVCLLNDFCSSLKAFIESKSPDIILLESSGLSDPIAIAEILQKPEIKDIARLRETWTIVDSKNFTRIEKLMTRAQHQLIVADHIILNKTDLSSREEFDSIKNKIRKINPAAKLYNTSYCKIDKNILSKDEKGSTRASLKDLLLYNPENTAPDIRTGVFKSGRKIKPERFKQLIEKYIPTTFRIKGFVLTDTSESMMVQSSYNSLTFSILGKPMGNTSIIFIGDSFNLLEFSRDFRKLAE